MDKDVMTDTEMLLAAFREFRLGMQNWIEKTGSKTTLTHPQMILLAVLDDLGESTMTALTRKMGTTMGAVTNLVDRLVYAGFLDRQHDTQDRRVVKVRLKDEGRDLIRSANAEIVLDEHHDVLLIPESALIYNEKKETFVEVPDVSTPTGRRQAKNTLSASRSQLVRSAT